MDYPYRTYSPESPPEGPDWLSRTIAKIKCRLGMHFFKVVRVLDLGIAPGDGFVREKPVEPLPDGDVLVVLDGFDSLEHRCCIWCSAEVLVPGRIVKFYRVERLF